MFVRLFYSPAVESLILNSLFFLKNTIKRDVEDTLETIKSQNGEGKKKRTQGVRQRTTYKYIEYRRDHPQAERSRVLSPRGESDK